VERAQGEKAPIARLADIISGYFVPVVIGIALVSGLLWYISGYPAAFALKVFISVLVIACPCALGLATPTAIMVASGKGAEHGILIKGGESLETAHKINMIVLDKTGTITEGKPRVTDILTFGVVSQEELLVLAASAEKGSEHPLGEAVVRRAEEQGLKLTPPREFTALAGRGLRTVIGEKEILIGNRLLMEENGVSLALCADLPERLASQGKTPMYVANTGAIAGIIAVADVIKEGSLRACEKLRDMGIKIVMMTGDNRQAAETIAKQVKIDRVLAEVLPEDKAFEVKKLQNEGFVVAMVG
jgi:P-type Cu+ transporter